MIKQLRRFGGPSWKAKAAFLFLLIASLLIGAVVV